MRRLERYYLAAVARPFPGTAVVFVLLVFVLYLRRHADRLLGPGLDGSDLAPLALDLLIIAVPWALPLALLFSGCLGWGRLAEDGELLATRALGCGPLRNLRWPVVLASVLALGVATFAQGLSPAAAGRLHDRLISLTVRHALNDEQHAPRRWRATGWMRIEDGIVAVDPDRGAAWLNDPRWVSTTTTPFAAGPTTLIAASGRRLSVSALRVRTPPGLEPDLRARTSSELQACAADEGRSRARCERLLWERRCWPLACLAFMVWAGAGARFGRRPGGSVLWATGAVVIHAFSVAGAARLMDAGVPAAFAVALGPMLITSVAMTLLMQEGLRT